MNKTDSSVITQLDNQIWLKNFRNDNLCSELKPKLQSDQCTKKLFCEKNAVLTEKTETPLHHSCFENFVLKFVSELTQKFQS